MQNPSTWLVNKPKFLAPTLVLLGLPIAYIIKKHVDWESKPDSKQRMLIHHLTFWPLFFLGIGLGHNARHIYQKAPLKASGWLATAIGTMIAGFEGGDRLARYLVPKQPKPLQTPFTARTASVYEPAFPMRHQSQFYASQNQLPRKPIFSTGTYSNYPSPFNRIY